MLLPRNEKQEARNSVWVKICGTTNLEDAHAAVEAGADALGFVFAESPRRVEPALAGQIASSLPKGIETVGVFVDESASRIGEIVAEAGLTAVQLHGDESVEFAAELARLGLRVFKAIPVRGGFAARMIAFAHRGKVEAVLLDSAAAMRGGTGVSFDWRAVAEYMPSHGAPIRVIVAGGLTPLSVPHAIRILRPWGVDVASGVEREPGKKDHEKVAAFVRAAKRAEF
jgi:phosphoribosylanthranilate isomerase